MFILIHKFILFVLRSFNERDSPKNGGRKRKWLVVTIAGIKVIKFGAQMFSSTREVGWCWLLAFKLVENTDRGLGKT
jgi:hypothetical protein